MENFYLFMIGLILSNSLYSLKDWKIYEYAYRNLRFYKFDAVFQMKIANDGTKDEFIVFSDFRYKIKNNHFLQFDIWTLLDLHKMYWIFKFRSRAKDLNLI